jgi:hypothetical protein
MHPAKFPASLGLHLAGEHDVSDDARLPGLISHWHCLLLRVRVVFPIPCKNTSATRPEQTLIYEADVESWRCRYGDWGRG